ncbi:uncharacterized protein J8A68_002709 [[Candida] subhashii]|uniref:Fe2OG dioxygenase domain-containing protein n=1 Tax=[Candida] subhashii TaxID=561895 RepID=A0A8J5QIR0_9ASCO|nr:uncharacterized protein J8A68_002709 [[Candida] subhashii]KAG7663762.1 hypothetical protein J8A68_002709 [[Candida] subhashii]
MPPKQKVKDSRSSKSSYTFPQTFKNLPADLTKSFYIPRPESIVSDQIIIINNFFTKELCNELIKSFERELTLETTPLIKSKEYALRYNDRCSIPDDLASSDILWQYLSKILLQEKQYDEDEEMQEIHDIFGNACGLNPQLRVYRYRKGHHFDKHYDESVVCPIPPKGDKKGKTKWTLLIYLTGDEEFKGGGTIFYPELRGVEPMNIHPCKGMALLHKHGDDCLKHEAEIVKDGEKWVLRSDVVYPI